MCEFFKSMNIFLAKFAMLVLINSVVIFFGGILYVLIVPLINENALSNFGFNDILMFSIYTIIPFVASLSVIQKIEPDTF